VEDPQSTYITKLEKWFRLMLTKYHIAKLSSDSNITYFIFKFSIIDLSRLIWIQVQFVPLAYMNLSVLKFKLIMKIYKGYGYSKSTLSQTFFTYMRTHTFWNWWGSWTLVPKKQLYLRQCKQPTQSHPKPHPNYLTQKPHLHNNLLG